MSKCIGSMVKIAYLPLHTGHVPPKLFNYMVRLGRPLLKYMVDELGEEELLLRFGDPFFFQAFGCILGFDWHSSGITTVVTGVLSKILEDDDIPLRIVGGKGRHAREIPQKLTQYRDIDYEKLIHMSKLVAKGDTVLLQDGYDIYHHALLFLDEDRWVIVQQGMNIKSRYARRYHWDYNSFKDRKYMNEPHVAIITDRYERHVINLYSSESIEAKKTMLDILRDGTLKRDLRRLLDRLDYGLNRWIPSKNEKIKVDMLILPKKIDWEKVNKIYLDKPDTYEELVPHKGYSKSVVRALTLVSELIYGDRVSWSDTVRYTYAVGGKDGVPYPIDYKTYKTLIEFFQEAVEGSEIEKKDKKRVLKRLSKLRI